MTRDDPSRSTERFRTEAGARAEAAKIRQQGFWGAVVKYVECKEDWQDDSAWRPDWVRSGESAVQLIEYF